jgi:hypothetical protein
MNASPEPPKVPKWAINAQFSVKTSKKKKSQAKNEAFKNQQNNIFP